MEPVGALHIVHQVEVLDFDFLPDAIFETVVVLRVQYIVASHVSNLGPVGAALAAVDAEHDGTRWNLCRNDYAFLRLLVARHGLGENLTETKTNFLGTDKAGTDKAGTVKAGTVEAGTVKAGTVKAGTDKAGTDKAGTDKAGTDKAGTDKAGTVKAGTVEAGTDKAGTVKAGTVNKSASSQRWSCISNKASGQRPEVLAHEEEQKVSAHK